MNCDRALEMMLEAEPGELRGQGSSRIAAHVRSCARCSAVAYTLMEETSLLARAVPLAGAIRRAPNKGLLVSAAIAAALLLAFAVRRDERRTVPVTEQVTVAQQPILTMSPSWARLPAMRVAPRRIVARPYAGPLPVRPVAIEPLRMGSVASSLTIVPRPRDAVDSAPAKRVAVFRTADPNITVVWLY